MYNTICKYQDFSAGLITVNKLLFTIQTLSDLKFKIVQNYKKIIRPKPGFFFVLSFEPTIWSLSRGKPYPGKAKGQHKNNFSFHSRNNYFLKGRIFQGIDIVRSLQYVVDDNLDDLRKSYDFVHLIRYILWIMRSVFKHRPLVNLFYLFNLPKGFSS